MLTQALHSSAQRRSNALALQVSELDEERRAVREILKRRQMDLPESALLGAPFPKSKLQPWSQAQDQTGMTWQQALH